MDVGSWVGVVVGVGGWKKVLGAYPEDYWKHKSGQMKNKPRFVTVILAIEFVFLVYFFVGGS